MIISVQYLRAIAALMVVAFHAYDQLARATFGENHFMVGLAGVDIFFVISGFIMWVTTAGGETTPAAFLRRRAIRIIPLYWMLTLGLALVAIVAPTILATNAFDLSHFTASMLFLPWPHPTLEAQLPLVIPGWTLNYEIAFYLLFAACLPLPKLLRFLAVIGSLVVLACLGTFAPPESAAAFYTNAIILEFAFGVAIAAFYMRGFRIGPDTGLVLTMFGAFALWNAAGTETPRIIGLGVPAAMIVTGMIAMEQWLARRPNRNLMFLGDASYSIYLSHVVTLAIVGKLLTFAGDHGLGIVARVGFLPAALASSILVGCVIYLVMERPLLVWMTRATRRSRPAGPTPEAGHVMPGEQP